MLRKGATYIYLIAIFFCTQPCYAQNNESNNKATANVAVFPLLSEVSNFGVR